MAAQRIVKHNAGAGATPADLQMYHRWMASHDQVEPFDVRVVRLWGTDGKGRPKKPGHHWTGIGDVRKRANKISAVVEEEYVKLYWHLSGLVHAGPMLFGEDFSRIEMHIGHGYFHTTRFAHKATLLTCDLLQLAPAIPELNGFRLSIQRGIKAAQATYPATSK